QKNAPSDRELQSAALRVTLAMRTRRPRSARPVPELAAAVALVATLAYAGASRWLTRHALSPLPPPSSPSTTLSSSPPHAPPPPPPAASLASPLALTPSPPPSPPSSTPHPTWADVSRALAAGDARAAERSLRDLAARGDASTRAKAQLGLAQLALANG